MKVAAVLVVLAGAAAAGIYLSGAFSSKASPQVTRTIVVPATRRVLSQLRSLAVRPGDRVNLAGTNIQCLVGRTRGVYLECAPLQGTVGFRPGSYGVVIRDGGAFVCRLVGERCSRAASRNEPGGGTLVAVPMPRRPPHTFAAASGSIVPVGGTSVLCDVEARTLFCGLARNVIGTRAIEVIYAASSFGIRISEAEAAIVRWRRDGTAEPVVRRKQP